MKTSPLVIFVLAFATLFPPGFVTPVLARVEVPKYNPATEAVFKGTIEEVRDRECAVSGGMGSSYVILKLNGGTTIEIHSASTEFVKTYELSFPSFACEPGSDRRRDNDPQNAPASNPRRHDVGSGDLRLLVSPADKDTGRVR